MLTAPENVFYLRLSRNCRNSVAMKKCDLENSIENIVGLKLDSVNPACEMLMFNFGRYAIHSQCLTRIIRRDDILVTTIDYQSWDGETDTNNDEWFNLDKYKSVIVNGKVISVQILPWYDLIIRLDNDVVIQLLIENSYAHYDDEREQYRFFEISNESDTEQTQRRHYVVYSKHIDLE